MFTTIAPTGSVMQDYLRPWKLMTFAASLSLYGMCGLVWLYRGSLSDLRRDARALLRGKLAGPSP